MPHTGATVAAALCACAASPFVHHATAQEAGQGADPWADSVVSYDAGADADEGYTDPATAIGAPTRFTGELDGFPGSVTPFNPAFGTDELVSIGYGGSLTLGFDEPVANDAANPYAIDLLVFGNTGFADADFPNGLVGGLFGAEGGTIELSPDGESWVTVDELADTPFPTLGYLDLAGPYDPEAGSVESDFTRPVDPTFDYEGATWDEILAAYDGAGGGVGIDIGAYGLDEVSYVRISDLTDDGLTPDIDAIADVAIPAPTALALLGIAGAFGTRRRRA